MTEAERKRKYNEMAKERRRIDRTYRPPLDDRLPIETAHKKHERKAAS